MSKTQLSSIIIVILIGIILGGLILSWDKDTPPTTDRNTIKTELTKNTSGSKRSLYLVKVQREEIYL